MKKENFEKQRANQLNRYNNTIFDFRLPGKLKDEADVYIVDGIIGYGKTSAAINFINDQPDFIKFIYITPYLSEIERIKKHCPERKFITPDTKNNKGSKMLSMLQLLKQGKNIISTHALFHNFNEDCLKLLKNNNYILIMDEVADVVEPISKIEEKDNSKKITPKDIRWLLALDDNCNPIPTQKPIIKINKETDTIEWIDDEYDGPLEELKAPAKLGCIMGFGEQRRDINEENKEWDDDWIEDDFKENKEKEEEKENTYIRCPKMFIWNYPISIYNAFYKIFILTYMFEGQMQCGYYKLHNVPYKYIHILREEIKINEEKKIDYNFIPETFNSPQNFDTSIYRNLIHIEEKNRCNDIGYPIKRKDSRIPLSKNWFNKEDILVEQLKKRTYNYFNNTMRHIDNKYKMWTTFKSHKNNLKDKGYTKGFIELNARATNQYKDRYVLAYLADRYPVSILNIFFNEHNVTINIDQFALSEMLQWIFRSRIRDGKEIWIYIPSLRMRDLLKGWMGLELEDEW